MLVFLLWLGYSRRQDSNLKRHEREARQSSGLSRSEWVKRAAEGSRRPAEGQGPRRVNPATLATIFEDSYVSPDQRTQGRKSEDYPAGYAIITPCTIDIIHQLTFGQLLSAA